MDSFLFLPDTPSDSSFRILGTLKKQHYIVAIVIQPASSAQKLIDQWLHSEINSQVNG